MNLRPREKTLLAVVGVLVLLVVGRVLWGVLASPIDARRTQRDTLLTKVQSKRDQVRRAEAAQQQLAQWNRQALPANVEQARRLYQNWLLELASRAKLQGKQVESGEVRRQRDAYSRLPFTVRGRGNLDQLTQFLFEFYSAGYLHQIRRLSIQPVEGSKDLDLVISVEALSLPAAASKDALPKETVRRQELADLAAYRKGIVERNLFGRYVPPPPPVVRREGPKAPPPPPFDVTRFAFVNGIVEVDGRREVWVKVRTSGETFALHEGDRFQIGGAEGSIVRIEVREVEIEVQGKRRLVALGENLQEASPAAPPAAAAATEAPGAQAGS